MNGRVSVVLTSYNRPILVREAISSVFQQTYPNWELIIVDDGSNERTRQVLDLFKDARVVKILLNPTDSERWVLCRYAVAINTGLERVTGEFVTYLTDDDYYLSHRFAKMVGVLNAYPAEMVVYGGQQVVHMLGYNQANAVTFRPTYGRTRNPHTRIDHCSIMHRASALERLSQPYWPIGNENWHDGDAAFFSKLTEHWDFVPVEGEILDVHRWHHNNVQSRMDRGEDPVYTQEL